ncbi:MAG: YfcE family phosphodiesterase [Desulfurococcales archaeon ex4484_217_1]|nr:MAG: YfcE family phosphodiesterase [Desulfurococcales archaeon ex4484_217_1]
MIKVLITGDTHIPTRARKIPKIIEEIIQSNKPYQAVFFTGDLISEKVLRYVKSLSEKVFIVEGNMDYLSFPEKITTKINEINIGLIHGHQVFPRGNIEGLTRIAEEMNVQILINGHTHYAKIVEVTGKHGSKIVLANPGSLTGVWSGGFASMRPSLIIGYFKNREVFLELYELYGTKLETKRYVFTF